MALPFANEYHLRTVAEALSKACMICYKPTIKVLITPNNKDFFYVCPGHLQDRGFASPKIDEKAQAEKQRKEQLQRDVELVKKEYEEKLKKKGKKSDDNKSSETAAVEKERDDKIKSLEAEAEAEPIQSSDDGPRIFILQKDFFQMRLDRVKQIETARRQQARMKDPTFFPVAPTSDLSNSQSGKP